jgi:hypothetical protein
VRTYVVRAGDSPGSIAAFEAGCPKCARDLIAANPHKAARTFPNGYVTFESLQEGERLNLPDKWTSKEFDELPPAYFKALPHPDGVTPSTLGDAAAGVLGDFAYLDAATTRVSVLDTIDDNWQFIKAADAAAEAIDAATFEAVGTTSAASASFARDVRAATGVARQRIGDLSAALDAGDTAAAADARGDIRSALATALGSARLALQSFYGGAAPPPEVEVKPAPPAPKPRPKAPAPLPPPSPPLSVPQPPPEKGISVAGLFGLSLLGAGVVGGTIYLATNKRALRRLQNWVTP